MLDRCITCEIEYSKQFCETYNNTNFIRFWDDNLTDMYTHNFTLIKNTKDIYEILINELDKRKTEAKSFLRIETNCSIDESIINKLPITPEITIYDYMCIETDKYKLLNGNPNCIVKKTINKEILKDGIEVDILANQGCMGVDFAQKRIKRKSDIYRLNTSNIDLYVCYHNDIAIGNCELMLQNTMAKIEDFDIIEDYQKKGFGTSVLKHLLKQASEANIELAYLITDSSDTAKEMYKKNGFYKSGEKTEFFFNL